MSGFTLPVQRSEGRALVVASEACREFPVAVLQSLGYECAATASPYEAMAELCRQGNAYQSLILSLQSVYREELGVIRAAKQQIPQLEVWICQTDGRAATLAEALNLGADGLLSEEGLHRFATSQPAPVPAAPAPAPAPVLPPVSLSPQNSPIPKGEHRAPVVESELDAGPLLSADELRALLHDHPLRPQVLD